MFLQQFHDFTGFSTVALNQFNLICVFMQHWIGIYLNLNRLIYDTKNCDYNTTSWDELKWQSKCTIPKEAITGYVCFCL